jgi:protoporphyrin/coproporphyrin ferrochelatase
MASSNAAAGPVTGILLVNLGTPDEPTPRAVRAFLKEFLSDSRVVDIPRIVWLPILYGIILTTRPAKTAKKYESIWTKDGSPLAVYTRRQAQLLRGYLGEQMGRPVAVEYAMRYGNPSIRAGIEALQAKGCARIVVLPLYPQYASSATGSVEDELQRLQAKLKPAPALKVVKTFHEHPAYIDAIVTNVLAHWMKIRRPDFAKGDKLVMTFHGVPRAHIDKGDPYERECLKTAELIAHQLDLKKGQYIATFQSRFGKAEWLKPYTDTTLEELGRAGTERVDVICPGFAADCLETLEEIAIEGKATFREAGGKDYHYLPVTNDTEPFIRAIAALIREKMSA